jgi:hypothetical protein
MDGSERIGRECDIRGFVTGRGVGGGPTRYVGPISPALSNGSK